MSRVGKKPVAIPAKVRVAVADHSVLVEGPLGKLDWVAPEGVSIKVENNAVVAERASDSREHRSRHGLVRAMVQNMITGVSQGYERTLIVSGVAYSAEMKGKSLLLKLGYSHTIEYAPPAGVGVDVQKNVITIKGIDKQAVGLAAAQIRDYKIPDPYKQKGVSYKGERLRKKEGKTGAA